MVCLLQDLTLVIHLKSVALSQSVSQNIAFKVIWLKRLFTDVHMSEFQWEILNGYQVKRAWNKHVLKRNWPVFSLECWFREASIGPCYCNRADSRLATSQWETALYCKDLSHWLGANLEAALMEYANKHSYTGLQLLMLWFLALPCIDRPTSPWWLQMPCWKSGHQAITRANVDPDQCWYNEIMPSNYQQRSSFQARMTHMSCIFQVNLIPIGV